MASPSQRRAPCLAIRSIARFSIRAIPTANTDTSPLVTLPRSAWSSWRTQTGTIGLESSQPETLCRKSDDSMSNKPEELEEDDIPEMDLSGGVRGKYYERYMQGTNVVLLEPDIAQVFRDPAVVNQALREYLKEHGTPPTLSKRAG